MKTVLVLSSVFALAAAQAPSPGPTPSPSGGPDDPDSPVSPASPDDTARPGQVGAPGSDDDNDGPTTGGPTTGGPTTTDDDGDVDDMDGDTPSGSDGDFDFDITGAETFQDGAVQILIEQNSDDDSLVDFTLICDANTAGWCAVGAGSEGGSMAGSTVYMCWPAQGDVYFSQRDAPRQQRPDPSPSQVVQNVTMGTNEDGLYGCKFSVDPTDSGIQSFPVDEEHEFLWALGEDNPPPDADTDEISRHTERGAFAFTISSASASDDDDDDDDDTTGSSTDRTTRDNAADSMVISIFGTVGAAVAGFLF